MNETLKKINTLLKKFNNTFELSAGEVVQEGEDEVTTELQITGLKNDGSEFVAEMFELFTAITQSVSPEHELVYNEEKGLVIGKKVVDYVFEED